MSRSAVSKSDAPSAVFRPRARADVPRRASGDAIRRAPVQEPVVAAPRAAPPSPRPMPRAAPITLGQILRACLLALVCLGFAQLSQPERARADSEGTVVARLR